MSKHRPTPDDNPGNLPERLRTIRIDKAFATIDDIVEAMDEANVFDGAKQREVVTKWKKAEARRLIRQMKDPTGWPVWFNIVLTDQDGTRRHVYGQEALFDLEQYKLAIAYFSGVSTRAAVTANELCRRARKKLGIKSRQLPLPFPGRDDEKK